MAKNRLHVEYNFDFLLLAINSNIKAYKLAWSINKDLSLALTKEENIEIGFKGDKSLSIQNFMDKNDFRTIRLLKNRADGNDDSIAYLLPELKNFDYFITLENESNTLDENIFIRGLKEIPFVQFITKIDLQTLKSKDNLIF